MKSKFIENLGKNIRLFRQKKGITIEQLAEKTDLSVTHVGNIERGQRVCKVTTLNDIAEALNVDIELFFNPQLCSEKAYDFKLALSNLEKEQENFLARIRKIVKD